MGDEEGSVSDAGVVVALGVVGRLDRDIVGLALDDDQRGSLVFPVLHGAPDDKISTRMAGAPSAGDLLFFGNLVEREAVLVENHIEGRLPDELLRRLDKPLLP